MAKICFAFRPFFSPQNIMAKPIEAMIFPAMGKGLKWRNPPRVPSKKPQTEPSKRTVVQTDILFFIQIPPERTHISPAV